jgi:arabinogalactan endo-1,4-beta-galactosidase
MSRPVFDRKSLLRHFSRVLLAAVLIAMPLAVILDAVSSSVSSQSRLSILGADVSTLQRGMELGAKYFNASGAQQNALDILKGVGVNYIRLRVWVNPASGYNNKNRVVAFAPQVKSRGLKLLIDLHYSDYWADPGRQDTPAAWRNHSLLQLQTDVYNHTLDVCNSLKNAGATPDMIQVGNEINQGLLWPAGQISNNNFANAAALLKAGYSAVKACSSSTQVALHIAAGGDNGTSRWWFDGMQKQGVQWDVTAESYYCFWHGSLSNMQSNVADLRSRYGKPVIIAETSYPFTTANADSQGNVITSSSPCGYPATWAGQANAFAAILNAARAGGAVGVFYWEPAWIATSGNGWDPNNINGSGDGWDNQAVFDWFGKINPNIRWTP